MSVLKGPLKSYKNTQIGAPEHSIIEPFTSSRVTVVLWL